MVVDNKAQKVESNKNKFNGDVSADDVVAVEDGVEEVIDLDDEKEEFNEGDKNKAEAEKAPVAEVPAEAEKADQEKNDGEMKVDDKKYEENKVNEI